MNSPFAQVGERGPAAPGRAGIDDESPLARAARVFATRCHARQRRASDGARFIDIDIHSRSRGCCAPRAARTSWRPPGCCTTSSRTRP